MLNNNTDHTYNKKQHTTTTFSSTLLDQIYRSISETDTHNNNIEHLKFYTHTMPTNKTNFQPCSIPNNIQQLPKSRYHLDLDLDLDQDPIFFSSTSISSDSSSGGFSSSDTESSIYTAPSKSSSALPIRFRPKPVRTSVSAKTETPPPPPLFYSHKKSDYGHNSSTEETPKLNESIFKSKSRALKMYNKVKQPISPGGKLANFINSIFTKKSPSVHPPPCSVDEERKLNSGQASTCSRSCLSKSHKFRDDDGVKRNVRFYPVDEDCRPCGHKSLHEDEESSRLMSVSLPTAWKIGKSPSKSRRVEQVARDFIREYNQKNENQQEDDDFDDAASYSSSDLFELDHLSVIGKDRYCEELPVYETTRLHTNRALIM